MDLKTFGNKVIVKVQEAETQTQAGIFIPDTAREKPNEGTVVAIGPDVNEVKVGDTVIFPKYSTRIEREEGEYVVLKEEDIDAAITGKEQ